MKLIPGGDRHREEGDPPKCGFRTVKSELRPSLGVLSVDRGDGFEVEVNSSLNIGGGDPQGPLDGRAFERLNAVPKVPRGRHSPHGVPLVGCLPKVGPPMDDPSRRGLDECNGSVGIVQEPRRRFEAWGENRASSGKKVDYMVARRAEWARIELHLFHQNVVCVRIDRNGRCATVLFGGYPRTDAFVPSIA